MHIPSALVEVFSLILPSLSSPWSPLADLLQAPFAPSRPPGLPVANPTRAFWTHGTPDANPLAEFGSAGGLVQDADVCVVGSGITGVGAAYHLSRMWPADRAPLKTVVFEARDFCSGATGRNGGHLTPWAYQSFVLRAARWGPSEAAKCLQLEAHTTHSLLSIIHENHLEDAVDLVDGGHVALLDSPLLVAAARADAEAAAAAGLNVSVEWLNADEVEETYGARYPAARMEGHNVWPLKLVTELFKLANDSEVLDLHLHTHTPVLSIEPHSASRLHSRVSALPRRWALTTPRGRTACAHVVTAANAYTPALLPALRGEDGIVPTRAQIITTRAAVPARNLTKSSWSSENEYWFPRPLLGEGEKSRDRPLVIIGGARLESATAERYTVDDSEVNELVGKELRAYLPRTFPGLYKEGQEPEMEWTGIMGYTKLADPFVGPVRDAKGEPLAGNWVSAGYTGHGMPRAFASAEAVTGMLVADMLNKTWERPPWFPAHFLRWPGV